MLRRRDLRVSLGLSGVIFTLIGAGLTFLAGALTGAGTKDTINNSEKRQDEIRVDCKELN